MEIEQIKELEREIMTKLFSIFGNDISSFKQKAEEINFLGTIEDFNLIHRLYSQTGVDENCEKDMRHLLISIDAIQKTSTQSSSKTSFSMECIKQLIAFKNNQRAKNEELLQATYMTIFSRYQDNKDKTNNIRITRNLRDNILINDIDLESDLGQIYMTYNEYQYLLERFREDEGYDDVTRGIRHNNRKIIYMLRNIRNNMAHGNFYNTMENGEKVVDIKEPTRGEMFKAKFRFHCLNHICDEISQQMGEKTNDILFEFKECVKESRLDKLYCEIKDDEPKMMSILFPLYINSFIVYNFQTFDDFLQRQKNAKGEELEILEQYYSDNEDGFMNKVMDYNGDILDMDTEGAFLHIRNSVVHNRAKFEDDTIHILDYDDNGKKTADFHIPYTYFKALLASHQLSFNYKKIDTGNVER